MKVVADGNIPLVSRAFAALGEVEERPGREIDRRSVESAQILLVRSVTRVDRELVEGTKLKFVASATTGTDHVDEDVLRELCIGFAHAPGSNARSVAEYVLTALITMVRKHGREPADLTLGIVGAGNIGSRVFDLASKVGFRCLANDPPKQRLTGSERYRPLAEVLSESDIVTLHVPLIDEGEDRTGNMVDRRFLEKMKSGAILINTSRGAVVDESVVLSGKDRIGGLVMDVWGGEPRISVDMVKAADIATPHIAGYAREGKVRGTEMICEAASAFFYKEPDLSWRPQGIREEVLDAAGMKDPLHEMVLRCCPVVEDDRSLRKIVDIVQPDKRAEHFDALRANYGPRHEFAYYDVVPDASWPPETTALLRSLGFSVRDAAGKAGKGEDA